VAESTPDDRTIQDTFRRCETCGKSYAGPRHEGCPGKGASEAPTRMASTGSRIDDLPSEARPFEHDPTRQLHQYVLVALLGKGGMGEVWKAWDRRLTRWVAIKFLLGHTDEAVLRFQREAKLAGRLIHPYIAAVYEFGEAPSRQPGGATVPFIAMQYIDGAPLGGVKKPLRELVDVFVKVAQGVDHAHRSGIVHRDLKPANVMLSRDGWPFVMDFGLARSLEGESGLSVTGAVMGTPAFMPPEQVEGISEEIGPQSDVYSLGATMYAVFCGQNPFAGQTTLQLLRKVCQEAPVPPRRHNPQLPEALEAAILRAMSKKKADRHPSAAALAEELKGILAKLDAPAAVPAEPPVPARPPAPSRPKASVAPLAVTILVFLLGAGVALWYAFRADPPAPEKPVAAAPDAAKPADPNPPAETPRPDPAKPAPGPPKESRTSEPAPASAKEPAAEAAPKPAKPAAAEANPAPAKPPPVAAPADPPVERGLEGAGLTPGQLDGAIRKGAQFLTAQYRKREPSTEADYLAVYALLLAAAAEDPAVAVRLGRFLRGSSWAKSPRATHAAALRALAIEASGDPSLRPMAAECAQYLVEAQGPKGTWAPAAELDLGLPAGAEPAVYVYGGRPLDEAPPRELSKKGAAKDPAEGNPVSTQQALLGLAAAERCGARAPKETWSRAVAGLSERSPGAVGSVNASLAGSLALGRRAIGDEGSGRASFDAALRWLGTHFAIDRDPGGEGASLYGWLAALESAGTLVGSPFLGAHEWYPAGAKLLLERQRGDGSWVENGESLAPTAAAILFLARATHRSLQGPPRGAPGELETRVAGAAPNLMFLLDASGAMRMELDGRERFDVAKEILGRVVEKLPEGAFLGLRVFGARRQATEPGAEVDTQLVIPPGPLDRRVAKTQLDLLRVRGKAPLTLSLVEMSKDVGRFPPDLDVSAVLLVDGRETDRKANPLVAVADLAGSRRGMKVHVVGFNEEDDDIQERLAKMAEAGGGRLLKAKSAQDLLSQVLAATVKEDAFVVLDAEGREVLKGRLGERHVLPEGRYTFVLGQGADRLEQPFWVNARLTTRLFIDAAKAPGAGR
jgi:serine/threonine protein kinase